MKPSISELEKNCKIRFYKKLFLKILSELYLMPSEERKKYIDYLKEAKNKGVKIENTSFSALGECISTDDCEYRLTLEGAQEAVCSQNDCVEMLDLIIKSVVWIYPFFDDIAKKFESED